MREPAADLLDVERRLGHEDHVGAAREPRVRRDPTGVATHHLHDHHAVVTLRRGVQPVDRVGRDLHGGVEAEGEVGRRQVVVDRLRHTDDLHAVTRKLVRDAERVFAADRDDRVDAVARESRHHARRTVVGLDRGSCATFRGSFRRAGADRGSTRAGAAPTRPRSRRASRAGSRRSRGRSRRRPCARRADDGVQTGAVTPAGEHADAHEDLQTARLPCPILRRARASDGCRRHADPRGPWTTRSPKRRRPPTEPTPRPALAPRAHDPHREAAAQARRPQVAVRRPDGGHRPGVGLARRPDAPVRRPLPRLRGAHPRPPRAVLHRLLHPPAAPAGVPAVARTARGHRSRTGALPHRSRRRQLQPPDPDRAAAERSGTHVRAWSCLACTRPNVSRAVDGPEVDT